MALYAIGDLHLSIGCDKPMDIFSGWTDHMLRLEQNWRSTVGEEDTVVIPGDVSWGMSLEEAAPDFAFLQSLPGRKLLLKGNHDYWWTTRRKMDAFFAERGFDSLTIVHNDAVAIDERYAVCGTRGWFYDAESDADKKVLLREVGRLHASVQAAVKMGLAPLLFLHYPPVYGGQVCEEIVQAIRDEGITLCHYGHVHGKGIAHAVRGWADGVEYRLISADAVGFSPVLVSLP